MFSERSSFQHSGIMLFVEQGDNLPENRTILINDERVTGTRVRMTYGRTNFEKGGDSNAKTRFLSAASKHHYQ